MKELIANIIYAMKRKRYYFVSFSNSSTGLGNIGYLTKNTFDVRRVESQISGAAEGGETIILSYKRISRGEFRRLQIYDKNKEGK